MSIHYVRIRKKSNLIQKKKVFLLGNYPVEKSSGSFRAEAFEDGLCLFHALFDGFSEALFGFFLVLLWCSWMI